jgi:hypothetical protein
VRIAAEDAQALPGRWVQAHLHLLDLVGVPPPGGLRGSGDGGRPALDAEKERSFGRSYISMDCMDRALSFLVFDCESNRSWVVFFCIAAFVLDAVGVPSGGGGLHGRDYSGSPAVEEKRSWQKPFGYDWTACSSRSLFPMFEAL